MPTHPDVALPPVPTASAPRPGGYGVLRPLVTFAASAGLLAAVVFAVGAADVARGIAGADPLIVAAALVLVQFQIAASAWRWRFTARRLGLEVPMGRAYLEYGLAGLVNMVLPGGVAGDALRTLRTIGAGATTRTAVRSVLLDRVAGQAAFWLVAGAGLALWAGATGTVPGGAAAAVAFVPAAGALAAASVFGLSRRGPARVRSALAGLGPDVRRAYLADGALLAQTSVSLLLSLSYVAVFWLAAAAVGAAPPPVAALCLIPLALLAMLVPVGVGGWGMREGAAALLWPLAGLGASEGAAAAALYGLVVTVGALPGLLALRPSRSTGSPASTA